MIKVKIKKSKEHFIGGPADNMPDSEFDPLLLKKGIDKEVGDHGLPSSDAKEIAKDELVLDPSGYSKELKESYNHDKFIEWLNSELPKQEDSDNKLLVEKKLSKYWRKRAARRALKAERQWPNGIDRKWALKQQGKSSEINSRIHKLFEKELEESEEMLGEIDDMMRHVKKKREKVKLKREAAKLMKPQDRLKKKQSLSRKYPKHKKGEGVGEYFRKASKKLGGIGVAPGESFGPAGAAGAGGGAMEEQKENGNENN